MEHDAVTADPKIVDPAPNDVKSFSETKELPLFVEKKEHVEVEATPVLVSPV